MIWAASDEIDRSISMSSTPNIGVDLVPFVSTPICRTWHLAKASTHNRSSHWPCVSSWKTAYHTALLPGIYGETIASLFRSQPSKTGSRARGKKAREHIETNYLDWALCDFSGYLAADELYDGPYCVLSAVDSPRQRRLLYKVLDHDPEHEDIRKFLQRLKSAIESRGGSVCGITTDGSPLNPQPISQVFGDIPHQVCEFHILKEITKAVLRVLARLRKQLAAKMPVIGRGRPTAKSKRIVHRRQAIQERVSDLFDHRHLFVRHHMTTAQRARVQQLIRGDRRLRALREIMDEVYRLFDRRCRTETGLAKLAHLRQRLKRFKTLGRSLDKLKSPSLEKTLTFLDDKLMPATSNAVERGNRRHRKMQKSIYSVRTQDSLVSRMAMDLQRDQHAADRDHTTKCLHLARQQTESCHL